MTSSTRETLVAKLREVNDELREALMEARKAIATLDEDSLGFAMVPATNEGGNGYAYPIRDELLAQIDAALNKQAGNV